MFQTQQLAKVVGRLFICTSEKSDGAVAVLADRVVAEGTATDDVSCCNASENAEGDESIAHGCHVVFGDVVDNLGDK